MDNWTPKLCGNYAEFVGCRSQMLNVALLLETIKYFQYSNWQDKGRSDTQKILFSFHIMLCNVLYELYVAYIIRAEMIYTKTRVLCASVEIEILLTPCIL